MSRPDSQTGAFCVGSALECVGRRSATAERTPTQRTCPTVSSHPHTRQDKTAAPVSRPPPRRFCTVYPSGRHTDRQNTTLRRDIYSNRPHLHTTSRATRPNTSEAHLPTEHSLFHAHVPLSATEVSLSQDRVCGTVYRLH